MMHYIIAWINFHKFEKKVTVVLYIREIDLRNCSSYLLSDHSNSVQGKDNSLQQTTPCPHLLVYKYKQFWHLKKIKSFKEVREVETMNGTAKPIYNNKIKHDIYMRVYKQTEAKTLPQHFFPKIFSYSRNI